MCASIDFYLLIESGQEIKDGSMKKLRLRLFYYKKLNSQFAKNLRNSDTRKI